MDLFIGSLILTAIVLVLAYFLHSNNNGDPSVPYAKYGSYPIIGHLIPFMRDRVGLMLECGRRYGSCFQIRVLNQRFTIISSHADWTNVVRNPALKLVGEDLGVLIFGISPAVLDHPEHNAANHRLIIQHLINRENLRPIVAEFIVRLRELLKNDRMEIEKKGTMSEWISTGLLQFSHHMLYQPSTLALFGDIDPASLENDFSLFDKNFHYLILGFPRWFDSWFLSSELQARSCLNKSWLKNRNPPNTSEFYRERVALLDDNSHWMSDEESGGFLTGFLWASLGNTIPAVFWSLFYILRDTKALETIRQEMDIHLPDLPLHFDSTDSSTENWTWEQLDACVYLESAINETIRLVASLFMTRKCIQQTAINLQDGRTFTVKPGETLAWFTGATHYDENFFPQPKNFVFDRFLNKKADNVLGYMPFGAGKSMCPGRFFAKYEIKTCVAMLLRYMEYKFEDTETIPSQKRARVGFGIAPPSNDIPILYRFKT